MIGLEGISHEEQRVQRTMESLNTRVAQLSKALQQADEAFATQLQQRLDQHVNSHDEAQIDINAALEVVQAKFMLMGRQVLTCDALVRKRDLKDEQALEQLRSEKARLHRQRLESKRELNLHCEAHDIAKRENTQLREELAAVQRKCEEAHRQLIEQEVNRRKQARQ